MSEIPAACLAFDEDLSALIDEELDETREAEVRAHLDGCARCARRLEELCNADLALASLRAPQVPGNLLARVHDELRAAPARAPAPRSASGEAPPRRRRWLMRRPAAAAALAAALAVALWLGLRGDEPVPARAPRYAAPDPVPAPVPTPEAGPPAEQLARSEPAVEPESLAPPEPPEPATELPDEDLALLLVLDEVEDLDVVANLELLERLIELERGAG